jgi:hypothetical protein
VERGDENREQQKTPHSAFPRVINVVSERYRSGRVEGQNHVVTNDILIKLGSEGLLFFAGLFRSVSRLSALFAACATIALTLLLLV